MQIDHAMIVINKDMNYSGTYTILSDTKDPKSAGPNPLLHHKIWKMLTEHIIFSELE